MVNRQSTSPAPFGHSLLDLFVGDQLTGVGPLEAPLDFGQEEQPSCVNGQAQALKRAGD